MPKAGKRSQAFADLRALRRSGKKNSYEIGQVEDLYEEVGENEYKKIVRERLNQDDFVVDDNGEGYADDGREEWDQAPQYETDSEDDGLERAGAGRGKGGKSKKQRDDEKAKRDATDRDISAFFTDGAAKAQPKPKIIKTEKDKQFLDDLLDDLDVPAPSSRAGKKKRDRSAERHKSRALSPIREKTRQPVTKKAKMVDDRLPPTPDAASDSNPMTADAGDYSDDVFIPVIDVDEPVMSDAVVPPSSPTARVAERKSQASQAKTASEIKIEEYDMEDEEMMEVEHAGTVTVASVNMSASRPAKKIIAKLDPYPSPASSSPPHASLSEGGGGGVDASSWNEVTQNLNVVSSSATEGRGIGKIDYHDAVEEDGSLRMFWTDYTEVNGSLCLFGKVLDRKSQSYVSCFVKVDNILRKLYFLPRARRVRNGRETDEAVEMMDVYNEVDEAMTRMKVGMYKIKACTRKYAFELPDIPREGQYLKLFYPYTKPPLEAPAGETFAHVFGANTALFEQFVLWKNIMGPCWLRIRDANFTAVSGASHCKLEALVENPDAVAPASDESRDAPPLTLMSLALRTTFNAAANKQEVLAISARIYENVSLSDTTPADKLPCRTFTILRPNTGQHAFPLGFEKLARERRRGLLKLVKQEHEMLSFFLAQVDVVDPDVIVGHQLEGVDYSILLNRLREQKTHQWSRLGRLRRSQWPTSIGKVGGSVFAERQIMAGRLLCDLGNDMGKSTMYKCQSWSLTEMCALYLAGGGGGDGSNTNTNNNNNKRFEFDNEAALKTWATTKEGLLDYVSHVEADTYFVAALALRVQILPLTRNLTNIAGNSWARTLTGTRAERNEFILLHEFHRNKYIVPDKQSSSSLRGGRGGRGGGGGEEGMGNGNSNEEEGGGGGEGSSKKAKYKGGLVIEPEKGLYDKFVLVMDFNSLYPSIIQEFNICFTTVERSGLKQAGDGSGNENNNNDDEDVVPEVPEEQELGVLPKLISTLVGRRREVKKLMKDKKATPEQLATWDIKQLALKLTANSMYGCLGYTRSRFYARPLAVLTTYKGREILRSTKELAESKSLQVIYGDTDSVMINANVDSVADALKVGREFKKAVNERYRLLEIDIDNVFRRILLQAKKKYAALNMVEVGGKWVEKMEVKGLDMKRREYCALSKEISSRLLNEILSGDDAEVAVQRIHAYLRETSAKMRERAVPPPKYIIHTQLGKNPAEYPNADSMPQVQVALREMARGKSVRKGDVIPYVVAVTLGADGKPTDAHDPPAKRARSPQDLRADPNLVPDVEWYIGKQIFPPVERLCANIDGTSTAQLAENLGLDATRYGNNNNSNNANNNNNNSSSWNGGSTDADREIFPLESQVPDHVRFRDCTRLTLRCRACKSSSPFEGLIAGAATGRVTAGGVTCAAPGCGAVLPTLSAVAQVEAAARAAAARYYEGWTACDDAACAAPRTRQVGVYGSRCLGANGLARGDCLGRVRYAYSQHEVYTQLRYLASLWDVDRALKRAQELSTAGKSNNSNGGGGDGESDNLSEDALEEVRALVSQNRVRFGTVKAVVDRYLDKCGWNMVSTGTLFAKLGIFAP